MSKSYRDDSLVLHTDLYQINMMQTYWQTGRSERKAVFEVYFRKLPFENGYAIFAGLERIITYLQNLRFSASDLAYLKDLGYPAEFLAYLAELVFTCSVKSAKE
ncbi:MAG: nicotinate phosphoribosyltransferase, partial [Streptococcaceae bacterium]|nr:nicotinate phosphoribosyltransferase [Streptococcaceae bacterium]